MIKFRDLKTYFNEINYSYKEDLELINRILALTKTRVPRNTSVTKRVYFQLLKLMNKTHPSIKSNMKVDFTPVYSMEQTFLLKAIADFYQCSTLFEIGTGRGTGSYSISECKSISRILTVDIIPHDQKQKTAINFLPAYVSNKDIFDLIPGSAKKKISFANVSQYKEIIKNNKNNFDLCFIDGNHDDFEIVSQDFGICLSLIKDGGVILWDDYDPQKYVVKEVIEKIMNLYSFKTEVIEFRGHIFGNKKPEKGAGVALMHIELNDKIKLDLDEFRNEISNGGNVTTLLRD